MSRKLSLGLTIPNRAEGPKNISTASGTLQSRPSIAGRPEDWQAPAARPANSVSLARRPIRRQTARFKRSLGANHPRQKLKRAAAVQQATTSNTSAGRRETPSRPRRGRAPGVSGSRRGRRAGGWLNLRSAIRYPPAGSAATARRRAPGAAGRSTGWPPRCSVPSSSCRIAGRPVPAAAGSPGPGSGEPDLE